jgi:ATP-dependent protease HslVU (ClpYQ) peptidase subunit
MTTIAASVADGVMCSDSNWTDGDSCGTTRKVHRVRGELIGLAGDLCEHQAWLADYRAGRKLSPKHINAIRLSSTGLSVWDCPNGWTDVGKQFAIGSGGKVARGALAAGATCRQAVRIAVDIDAGTGGRVRQYKLRTT